MLNQKIIGGTVHEVPPDLKKSLVSDKHALERWEDLTPLARNEWICWTITTKKPETRKNHVGRTITELKQGKRRPCCWIGCFHRTDKAISPSVQWALDKQSKKN
ncbi:YdeI/OmpD-associated family protein [Candidatus Saccharibacteria bacterium]|nr:YdeI/OmpD-associated family protein [Candidatus Saccharibacteria bacterium]